MRRDSLVRAEEARVRAQRLAILETDIKSSAISIGARLATGQTIAPDSMEAQLHINACNAWRAFIGSNPVGASDLELF